MNVKNFIPLLSRNKISKSVQSFSLRKFTSSRVFLFLMAFGIAWSLWWTVVRHDVVENEIEVTIGYRNLPERLMVTNGRVSRVTALISGPKALMATLPTTFELPVDLSGLKQGDGSNNIFSPIDEMKRLLNSTTRRAFKILDVQPSIIRLHAEYVDRINVPIDLIYRSESDMSVVTRNVSNNSVALHGPQNEIAVLKTLSALPLDVYVDLLDVGKKSVVRDVPVLIPASYKCPFVTAEPSSVKVEYIVIGERVTIRRSYSVNLAVTNANLYSVEPQFVVLTLKVPESRQRDTEYLNALRVTALPPDLKPGESRQVRLSFTPPEGMEIIDNRREVLITRNATPEAKESSVNAVLPRSGGKLEDKMRSRVRAHEAREALEKKRMEKKPPSHPQKKNVNEVNKKTQDEKKKNSVKKEQNSRTTQSKEPEKKRAQ